MTTDYESLCEQYELDAIEAGDAYILANLKTWTPIADAEMALYRGECGGFRRRMEHLGRQAARLAGFPNFAEWVRRRETPQQSEAA